MRGQVLASDHPKLIYFAERRANMDATAFRTRWRQHAWLGMSMPRWQNIQRYVHCDAIAIADSQLPLGYCDGVGIVWYRNEARRLNHVGDRSAAPLMKQDESEAFARPVREVALLADEFTLKPCADAPHKLFLRIWREPSFTRSEFRSWWLKEAGPEVWQRLAEVKTLQGYIQNHARLVDSENAPLPLCDCIDEIACEDITACESVLSQALSELRGFDDHVRDCKAIWTSETVLYAIQ
ncbi:MAG: hypothetical protein ACI8P9_000464 [Parasphingorhabdus sp.]|jgi:hypothetical protein